MGLLQWFHINRYCGPELDDDHVACVPIFLQGAALTWFNNNIEGMDHQKETWSFKMVVIRLYDRFLHNVAVGATSDKFWSMNYASVRCDTGDPRVFFPTPVPVPTNTIPICVRVRVHP